MKIGYAHFPMHANAIGKDAIEIKNFVGKGSG